MQSIAPKEQQIIKEYLQQGRKLTAIKYFCRLTGNSLAEATAKIDNFIRIERLIDPNAYENIDKNFQGKRKGGFTGIIILFIIISFIFAPINFEQFIHFFQHPNFSELSTSITKLEKDIKQSFNQFNDSNSEVNQKSHSDITNYQAPRKEKTRPKVLLPSEQYQETNYLNNIDLNNLSPMQVLYQKKLANKNYQDWKSQKTIPQAYQTFPFETDIKSLRSSIAAQQQLPQGETSKTIPLKNNHPPEIDGKMSLSEWQHSLKISLKHGSTIYLQADKKWLYLAADVPEDTTAKGYDQFRFNYHVNLMPEIRNERIHVRGSKRQFVNVIPGYRSTTIRWLGDEAKTHEERWKKYPISDRGIYKLAQGGSSINGHRQYEAKISLAEAGLHTGVVFAAFAVIETDPLRKANGKFKKRQYLGKLANQRQPQWFIIK